MAVHGPQNGRWNGGTWVNSSGYVMVWVGKDHPMASCRAYAKRCRLVLFETQGPPPNGDEHAHHLNGDKTDDRPENLEWRDPSDHSRYHLTSERAKKIGAKGGRKAARLKRQQQRQLEEKHRHNERRRKASQRRVRAA